MYSLNDNLEATAQAVLQDKIASNGIETTVDSLIDTFSAFLGAGIYNIIIGLDQFVVALGRSLQGRILDT